MARDSDLGGTRSRFVRPTRWHRHRRASETSRTGSQPRALPAACRGRRKPARSRASSLAKRWWHGARTDILGEGTISWLFDLHWFPEGPEGGVLTMMHAALPSLDVQKRDADIRTIGGGHAPRRILPGLGSDFFDRLDAAHEFPRGDLHDAIDRRDADRGLVFTGPLRASGKRRAEYVGLALFAHDAVGPHFQNVRPLR